MPDPRDPSPVKAVQRGGKWVVVGADGKKLPHGEFASEGEASTVAGRVNRAWARAKSERRRKGAPEITEAFAPARHPRGRGGKFTWEAHVPLHLAGSGGKTMIGRFEATEDEVRQHFGDYATINPSARTVRFYKKPKAIKESAWPFTGGRLVREKFDPRQHPRGRVGRFREVLAQIAKEAHGSSVELPHGVRVRSHFGGLVVEGPAGRKRVGVEDASYAALHALGHYDQGAVAAGTEDPEVVYRRRVKELIRGRDVVTKMDPLSSMHAAEDIQRELLVLRHEHAARRVNPEIPAHRGRTSSSLRGFREKYGGFDVDRFARRLAALPQTGERLPKANPEADRSRPALEGPLAVETGYGRFEARPHPHTSGIYELHHVGPGGSVNRGMVGTRPHAEHVIAALHDEALARHRLGKRTGGVLAKIAESACASR